MHSEAIYPDREPMTRLGSVSILSFAIGLKDSRVTTDNGIDMVAASFIPKEIRKKMLNCIQKASGIKQNIDLFSKTVNAPCIICSTQYSWLINLKYIIHLDDYKSQF